MKRIRLITCGLVGGLLVALLFGASNVKHGLLEEDVGMYNALQKNPNAPRNAATLSTVLALSETANKRVFLPVGSGTWTIDSDVNVAATRTLHIPCGVVVNIASGKTLAGSGKLILDCPRNWKTGAGHLAWTGPMITGEREGRTVTPQMFGAKCDGTTNDGAAIQEALTTLQATGGTLYNPGDICHSTLRVAYHSTKPLTWLGVRGLSKYTFTVTPSGCETFICNFAELPAYPFYDHGMVNISGTGPDAPIIGFVVDGVAFDFGGLGPSDPPSNDTGTNSHYDGDGHGLNVYYVARATINKSDFANSSAEMVMINQFNITDAQVDLVVTDSTFTNGNVDCLNPTGFRTKIINSQFFNCFNGIEGGRATMTVQGNSFTRIWSAGVHVTSPYTVIQNNIFTDCPLRQKGSENLRGCIVIGSSAQPAVVPDSTNITGNIFRQTVECDPDAVADGTPGDASTVTPSTYFNCISAPGVGPSQAITLIRGAEDEGDPASFRTLIANNVFTNYQRTMRITSADGALITNNYDFAEGMAFTHAFAQIDASATTLHSRQVLIEGNYIRTDVLSMETTFVYNVADEPPFPNDYGNLVQNNYINGVLTPGRSFFVTVHNGGATPALNRYGPGGNTFQFTSDAPQSITDIVPFTGRTYYDGFTLYIFCGDDNQTFVTGSGINLAGGANLHASLGTLLVLTRAGTVWFETGRYFAPGADPCGHIVNPSGTINLATYGASGWCYIVTCATTCTIQQLDWQPGDPHIPPGQHVTLYFQDGNTMLKHGFGVPAKIRLWGQADNTPHAGDSRVFVPFDSIFWQAGGYCVKGSSGSCPASMTTP